MKLTWIPITELGYPICPKCGKGMHALGHYVELALIPEPNVKYDGEYFIVGDPHLDRDGKITAEGLYCDIREEGCGLMVPVECIQWFDPDNHATGYVTTDADTIHVAKGKDGTYFGRYQGSCAMDDLYLEISNEPIAFWSTTKAQQALDEFLIWEGDLPDTVLERMAIMLVEGHYQEQHREMLQARYGKDWEKVTCPDY